MKNILIFFVLFSSAILSQQSNWRQINSPGGGNINCIFQLSDSIFIAGIQEGSIYRSSDCGKHWQIVHKPNTQASNLTFISFCLNLSGDILTSSYIDGILKSTDKGLTWKRIRYGISSYLTMTKSGILFSSPVTAYPLQIYKSTNGGTNWNTISLASISSTDIRFLTSYNDELIIATNDSLYSSSDFGQSWIVYGVPLPSDALVNSLMPVSENQLFAATDKGIYLTTDRGMTWMTKNSGLPSANSSIKEIKKYENKLFAFSSQRIFCSTDSGDSWLTCALNKYININGVIPVDSAFIVSSSLGVFKYANGIWTNLSSGIFANEAKDIFCADNGDLIYETDAGIFRSTDHGKSWINFVPELITFDCSVFTAKNNCYITQASDNAAYISTDFGESWSKGGTLDGGATCFAFSRIDSNCLYSASYRFELFYGPWCEFYYSSNKGNQWIKKGTSGYNFYSFVNIMPGDTLYVRIYDLLTYTDKGIYSSVGGADWREINKGLPNKNVSYMVTDKNNNLYAANTQSIYRLDKINSAWVKYADLNLSGLANIIFNKYNQMILAKYKDLYGSADGINWSLCGPDIAGNKLKCISEDSEGYYYAADETGRLYKTITPHLTDRLPAAPALLYPADDVAANADTINLKWLAAEPLALKYKLTISEDSLFSAASDTLVTTTRFTFGSLKNDRKYYWKVRAYNEIGEGPYSSVSMFYTGTTSSKYEPVKVFSYALRQNYPNPFNPVTNISYSLAKAGEVEVKVFNVLGMETMTLVNGFENEGDHTIKVDASLLPSGVYFYRIKSGNFTDIKKMVLLK